MQTAFYVECLTSSCYWWCSLKWYGCHPEMTLGYVWESTGVSGRLMLLLFVRCHFSYLFWINSHRISPSVIIKMLIDSLELSCLMYICIASLGSQSHLQHLQQFWIHHWGVCITTLNSLRKFDHTAILSPYM